MKFKQLNYKMIDKHIIKEKILKLGADLCGFAPIERFNEAPKGFHPLDIYKGCKTVIIFAKTIPRSSFLGKSCVPYTHVNTLVMNEVDVLTLEIVRMLEELNIKAVLIPCDDPYEYWDEENKTFVGFKDLST